MTQGLWSPKNEGERILSSAYRYLVTPMTEFRVPSYLRPAMRWNATCDALKVVSEAAMLARKDSDIARRLADFDPFVFAIPCWSQSQEVR